MLAIAIKILFCLIIVAILSFILGYILGRIITCDKQKRKENLPKDMEEKKSFSGVRPNIISAIDVVPDDLKQIKGIGEKIEQTLNELGILTFEQIANLSSENVAWIDEYLSFKGRIEREDWVGQAKLLQKGEDTEFSIRYKSDQN